MKYITALLLVFFVVGLMIPSAFAENVPEWVKNTAGWWATNQIDDSSFLQGIQYLIKEKIIIVPPTETAESAGSQEVPSWIKNNAGWWAEGQINDSSFVLGIQWLISNGIIKISEECMFEGEEYSHLFDEERKLLCDEFNFNFVTQPVTTSDGSPTYNSEGFRGPEFLKEKPDNTYRIFAIGGSTTFGGTNFEAWPHYLREIFDTLDLNYNVEIINVGISSGWSGSETKLIGERILDYNPDMLMVYDGWNDIRMQLGEPQGRIAKPEMANPTLWKERWIESCEFTNANNVKTIVTLQPFLGTGYRVLSNQEQANFNTHTSWIINDVREYTKYQKQLEEISKYCTETKDLTDIFDRVAKPIYWDLGHVGVEGDKIVATHFFKLALPYIPGNEGVIPSKIVRSFLEESPTKSQHILKELDLRGKDFVNEDFTNQDLRESVFHISRFQNADFSNADLESADFKFTIINGGNFDGASLKNAEFSRAIIISSDFSSADLTNVNLSTTKISNTKFTNTILSNSKFFGVNLYNIDLDGANLENSVFENSIMIHSDMKNAKIKNMKMRYAHFYNVDFNGVDFSEISFGSQNAFAGSDFRNSNLPMLQLVDTDFSSKAIVGPDATEEFIGGANLSDLDFSNTDMSRSIFSYQSSFADYLQLSTDLRSEVRNFGSADLTGANLTGANLSGKNLTLVIFYGANLSNADLSGADLRYADLRNADLGGSDLTNANLEFADLHGAYFDDNTILKCINHSICLDE